MLDHYFNNLPRESQDVFCTRTGISRDTMKNAYLRDVQKRKVARPDVIARMIRASDSQLSVLSMCEYFYVSHVNFLLGMGDGHGNN